MLEAISNYLLKNEKMNGLELITLIKDIRPELVPSSTTSKVEEFAKLLKSKSDSDPAVQLAA